MKILLHRIARLLITSSGVALGLLLSASAIAASFISTPDRRDFAIDDLRSMIYISTPSAGIQRFNVATGSFEQPFAISGDFYGIDISPDGNMLAVADYTYTNSPAIGQFWLINLQTNEVTKKSFPLGFMETGSWSVAWGADGNLYFSVSFQGSGWTPIRRWKSGSDSIEVVARDATQAAMLSASHDRQLIGWVEPNNSTGPVGTYDIPSATLLRTTGYSDGTSWYNYEVATSHDGAQLLVPTYGGLYKYNEPLSKTGPVYGTYAGEQPIGAAFLPGRNVALMPISLTNRIRVLDTNSWTALAEYSTPSVFDFPYNRSYQAGRIKVSREGDLAVTSVPGGLQVNRLIPVATPLQFAIGYGQSTSIALSATRDSLGGQLTFTIVTPPSGALTGVGANLTYLPGAHCCNDRFAYTVSDGVQTSAPAWVDIQIASPPPPTAESLSANLLEDGTTSIQLKGQSFSFTPLDYRVTMAPGNGTLTGTAPNLVYSPSANFNGTDTFRYVTVDKYNQSQEATVTITVTAVNDRPSFTPSQTSISVRRGSGKKTFTAFAMGLQAGADNESAQTFSFTVQVGDSRLFSVQPSINSAGTLTFTPSSRQGSTTMTITMKDNGGVANGGIDTAIPVSISYKNVR